MNEKKLRWIKASERLPEEKPIYSDIVYCIRWTLDGERDWFYGSAPGRRHIEAFHEWLEETEESPTTSIKEPTEEEVALFIAMECKNYEYRMPTYRDVDEIARTAINWYKKQIQ